MKRLRIITVLGIAALATTAVTVAAQGRGIDEPRESAPRQGEFLQVRESVTVPPGEFRTVTVDCPAGRTPTGGGWTASGGVEANFVIMDSYPLDRSWTADGRNTGTVNAILTVEAVCAVGSP
ncbi:hypothetical protein [Streptomyces sp. G45]|uniref:hypothetical protein n=1 Tax=Streptomyces sp. G45 TaxID=3406627 RepID=UPI003C1AEC64